MISVKDPCEELEKERRRAVREAWKIEKKLVMEGKGTRDWSPEEQRNIITHGKVKGYEGHHMKSVMGYPKHAGNPKNIQFLTESEHLNGAHRGNTQNVTNGYYNPKTRKIHKFGNKNPQAPPPQALSNPLAQKQKDDAIRCAQAQKQSEKVAKDLAKMVEKARSRIQERLSKGEESRDQGQPKESDAMRAYKAKSQASSGKVQERINTQNQSQTQGRGK